MPLRTLSCAIEDLEGWYPGLFLEPHCVACVAVCAFSSRGHRIRVSQHGPAEA